MYLDKMYYKKTWQPIKTNIATIANKIYCQKSIAPGMCKLKISKPISKMCFLTRLHCFLNSVCLNNVSINCNMLY